ncbi:hypothetical protein [Puniceicoccus vermicola]|uniref:EF-hand domain-containing protein n=1 Tax=Puniceicoccus vermicola TaxID=388746 RepID=A0A7X1B0B4_9BACT|nr:hypothetical protein [Puniceicoccus vermicola]MBC2603114.1 hypothetical protein [Puniceicoccus vermicola]
MDHSNDTAKPHLWKFRKVGKTFQVQLESPDDLRHLRELDPKLWVALSCPVDGLEIDRNTLALIDADGDGRVRLEEVITAVEWTLHRMGDPSALFNGGDLPIDAISSETPEGKAITISARQILENTNDPNPVDISVGEAANTRAIFGQSRFNGDGIIARDAVGDEDLGQTFDDIIKVKGSVPDLSGQPGIDSTRVKEFFAELRSYNEWWTQGEKSSAEEGEVFPLGSETPPAFQALVAVEKKIDDYFARCRLASFDDRALDALNREASLFEAVAKEDFSISRAEIVDLPLAKVGPLQELPLQSGINPEWAARMSQLQSKVLGPLPLEIGDTLTAKEWSGVKEAFSRYRSWHESKPPAAVEVLGVDRIRSLIESDQESRFQEILAEEAALAERMKAVTEVEKLARMNRDLIRVLRNFVNFDDFYEENEEAIFQAGVLYLDGRECRLCLKIEDPNKHAPLGGLARAFLAYCECRRKDSPNKFYIAAVFSAGDSSNLLVGRNGVFLDKKGKLWDSTVVKIVENPISIHEAFFLPYVRIGRFISEQVEKWATSRDKAMQEKMQTGVTQVSAKPKGPPQMGQIGGIAAMLAAGGIALGAVGAGLASLFSTLGELRYWELPLVFVGLILLVSLPSMFIAWMRLRKRTLGPLLDAAGWAVNGKTLISFRLGKLLTRRATLPPGATIELVGGAAARTWLWVLLGLTVVASALGWGFILFL